MSATPKSLQEAGFVRLSQIIGNPKANPPIAPLIPIGKTAWWCGIKDGRYPQPVKLGPRITAWRISDLKQYIEQV